MKTTLKTLKDWWNAWGTFPIIPWVKAANLYKDKRYSQAISLYQKGLEKHSSHKAATCAKFDLAYCYFKTKNYEKSENILRQVIKDNPSESESYIRLAKLLNWIGNPVEASWVLRRAIDTIGVESELVIHYCYSVIEAGLDTRLFKDAIEFLLQVQKGAKKDFRIDIIKAAFALARGERNKGRIVLSALVNRDKVSFEAHLYFSEILLQEKRVPHALRHLRRALSIRPNHPRILSLLAEAYLLKGDFYNPQYAVQLSTLAAQETNWLSPACMHVLAESYRHSGDKMSALVMASKAKDTNIDRIGSYRKVEHLEELIDTLSSSTLA